MESAARTFILRVEGVDFSATLEDAQQLSAYRGGSLTLLQAAEDVEQFLAKTAPSLGIPYQGRIFAGASIGAWRFAATDEAKAEVVRKEVEKLLKTSEGNAAEAPHAYMSYVVDVAEGDDLAALTKAEARNRASQFRRSSRLPFFDPRVKEANKDYDRIRPADATFRPPKGKLLHDTGEAADGDPVPVSASFAARHKYGRAQRQQFYKKHAPNIGPALKGGGFVFTNHFEDIVADLPKGGAYAAAPDSIREKLAIFYADGNKFGDLYRCAPSIGAYADLSRHMRELQSKLLDAILAWLRQGATSDWWQAFALRDPEGFPDRENYLGLRFETLLWGGDELTFVMPAWLGLEFLDLFLATTKDWKATKELGEVPLTFAAGLVFCHHKTPIRQARKVAKTLADDGKWLFKDHPGDLIQIEAFESIALPEAEGGVGCYRRRLYETKGDDAKLRRAVTLSRADWDQAYTQVKKLRGTEDEGLPRSQIYKLLRLAAKKRAFALDGAAEHANGELEKELNRYRERVRAVDASALALPGRALAYSLALYAVLWGYAALPSESSWPAAVPRGTAT